ncbi:hypothetical protein LVJ94_21475 [Pendulispora rubella]|uniref:Tetratricopeptide repeat protein n=1 Tax=Pendulispora rubella TaxID=2741070 RepID=A0ABZ2LFT9_9BACT
MVQPLEELNEALGSFVEQGERFVLLLTSQDEEIPLIVKALDALDGESPSDVFFTDVTPVRNGKQYADEVIRNAWNQLAEVNAERQEKGMPPLAEFPPGCWAPEWTPAQRLATLIRHMTSWLPAGEDGAQHRLVFTLLPADIQDREAHAQILGSLVPFQDYEPWMSSIRLVLRDDAVAPFAQSALRKAGVRSVYMYNTRLTVAAIADATAQQAENTELPPAIRINAFLQCATFDVAMGRYDAALQKFGQLYLYYEQYQLTEMKALVTHAVGDILMRVARFPAARDKFLQALDLASDAKSLALIMQIAASLGDVDMQMRAFPEAAKSYGIGANAAEKIGNSYARADLLEKCGVAHASLGDLRGAVEAWTAAAVAARSFFYHQRLSSVLERLRDVSAQGGYRDVAANYERELREVRQRLSAPV